MGVKNFEVSIEEFKSKCNQIEDLLTSEDLKQYQEKEYPDNVPILYNALIEKIKTEPDYEVWAPFKYYRYELNKEDIRCYYTRYVFISNTGKVYHLRKATKAVNGNKNNSGYSDSRVRTDDGLINFRIHRAVACCFIPISEELNKYNYHDLQVNHKDTVKSNNDLTNLEWCTGSQNAQHAVDNLLRAYLNGISHYATKPVLGEVHLPGPYQGFKFIRSGKAEIASLTGTDGSSVNLCCNGRLKQAKGCYWRFATNKDILDYSEVRIPNELIKLIKDANANWKGPIIAERIKDNHLILLTEGPKQMTELGFMNQGVYSCCTGDIKVYKGHTFRRAEDQEEVDYIKGLIASQTTKDEILVINKGSVSGLDNTNTKTFLAEVLIPGDYLGHKFILFGNNGIRDFFKKDLAKAVRGCVAGKFTKIKGCKWSYATDEEISEYKDLKVPDELRELLVGQKGGSLVYTLGTRIVDGRRVLFNGTKEIDAGGFVHRYVSDCVAGKIPSYKGYVWRLLTPDEDVIEIQKEIYNQTTIM